MNRLVAWFEPWLAPAPACRLATFRVLVAAVTILFHLPQTDARLADYAASSFHVPVHPLVPALPVGLVGLVSAARWVAAVALLAGLVPRVAAALLAATSAWVLGLDVLYYSHHYQFHTVLLVLLVCARDGLPVHRLVREDAAAATCPGWPEHLVRVQLGIVMFWAALDKVLSADWGLGGSLLREVPLKPHRPPLSWVQAVNGWLIREFPGVASVGVVATEFLLAGACLVPALHRLAVILGLAFAAHLELTVTQAYFALDVAVVSLLFLPAADRGYGVAYDAERAWARGVRAVVSRLDWHRRIAWVPAAAVARGLTVTDPAGRRAAGILALGGLVPALAPASLLGLAIVRSGFGRLFYVVAEDLTLVAVAILLTAWMAFRAGSATR